VLVTATETDPYLTPSPRSTAVVRRWAYAALVAGSVYLSYRMLFTLGGADLDAALALFAAETLALVVFGLRALAAWHDPAELADVPDAPLPSTTVVIDAAGSTPEAVRTTLVSCGQLRGRERVVVADPTGASRTRAVADRFGATTVEQPATVVAAETNAMWVLLVRAGDLPLPDALEILATPCSAPDAGVIQLGVEEANPSSFEHDPKGRWSLAPFEHQVVRPSLAAAGSIPWYGDVPALVRPVVIRDAPDPAAPTVDLGLHAISLGYRVTMVPRTLARLRGPRSLTESLRRRFERTAALRRAATRRLGDLPTPVRRSLRVALADPLGAVQRVLLAVVAVLSLGFGRVPIDAEPWALGALALGAYGLRWQAQILLGRGRLGRFSVLRSELRSVGVDLAFGRDSGSWQIRHRFVILAGMVTAMALAVAMGALAVTRDQAEGLSKGATAVALALTAGFLVIAAEVLLDAVARRQRRGNHRVRLGLVACRLDDHEGALHDLALGGCGLVVAESAGRSPTAGDEATVMFRIPDANGAWRDVTVAVRIAHVAASGEGELRIGAAFADPTGAALDPVIEFLTIDRRLVSLGRRVAATG
jgi:hypothetical protein